MKKRIVCLLLCGALLTLLPVCALAAEGDEEIGAEVLTATVFRCEEVKCIFGEWCIDDGGGEVYGHQSITAYGGKPHVFRTYSYLGKCSMQIAREAKEMVKSVQYTVPARNPQATLAYSNQWDTSGYYGSPYRNIGFSLLMTIAIYSLPILIYRYFLRNAPVERKKAKKITIIYGICAFVVMSFALYTLGGGAAPGGAILLWSYVNYKMLTSGLEKGKDETFADIEEESALDNFGEAWSSSEAPPSGAQEPEKTNVKSPYADGPYAPVGVVDAPSAQSGAAETAAPEAETAEPKREVLYCCRCGMRLEPDSNYCTGCGAKRYTEEGTR